VKLLSSRPAALLCAAALLWPGARWNALTIAAGLAGAFWLPRRRAEALSATAVGCFLVQLLPESFKAGWGLKPLLFSLGWVGGVLALTPFLARLKHPALWLHAGAAAGLAALATLNITGIRVVSSAAALQLLTCEFVWRSTYWVKWRQRAKDGARPLELLKHLYALVPFFRMGGVPLGKQPEYMARHEARNEEEVREGRIEGIRLLVLAMAWRLALRAMDRYVFAADPVAVPSILVLLQDPAPFSLAERWAGLFMELFRAILDLAVWWHTMVGVFQLAGYRIPRNVDAPLLASTVLDFWNRYFFYFKELLVDFFFFPAFLRLKGCNRAARSALAIFAAAFLGNLYYHALLYSNLLMEARTGAFGEWMLSRVVYCAALATGLAVSMYRTLRNPAPAEKPWARRVLGTAAAGAFFAVIHVWNAGPREITFEMRSDLMRALLGLG
jgi:hypothetical protein